MATNALIYDAYILCTDRIIDVVGLAYGVVDDEEFDGEVHQTFPLRKAWIDDMGIGVIDSQRHQYMVLSLDEQRIDFFGNLHRLFALSFLHDKPTND